MIKKTGGKDASFSYYLYFRAVLKNSQFKPPFKLTIKKEA
jgi:hypothetical protein